MDLGKIRERRVELGMTQEELAEKANVSRQTISALESGTERGVMSKTLVAIAEALNTTADKFFADGGKPVCQ